jgi:hypothetical protein
MNGLKISTGGHRYVYCSICHKGTHRGKNAAKKYTVEELVWPSFVGQTMITIVSFILRENM